MKFQRIVEAVYFQPWMITPAGWNTMHSILKPYLSASQIPQPRADDDTDFWGDPLPKLEIHDSGVAIIPVKGHLLQHAGLLDKQCGARSYADIKEDLQQVEAMGIEEAIFDIGSPGGQCLGNQELCDYINELRMQGMTIHAFSESVVCSAAYNIAASCDSLFITRTCMAANIGTLMALIDCRKQFEEAGLKVELFASGKFKGVGTPGVSLTDEQREYLDGLKETYARMFKDNVRMNRPDVAEESMEGQVIIGEDAVELGIADDIVGDLEEAIDIIQGE